jgi:hypothetical protein
MDGNLQSCVMNNFISDVIFNVRRAFGGIQQSDMAPQMPLVYRYTKSDALALKNKYVRMYKSMVFDLGMPKEQSDKLTTPLLKWVSEYLIFLPASEHYHHIEPGAFYLHCVQTANKSAQLASSDSTLFFNVPMEERETHKQNFTFAAWIGGLIHDLGKPIADMDVYAVDR